MLSLKVWEGHKVSSPCRPITITDSYEKAKKSPTRQGEEATFNNTAYTYENGASLGGAFTCKRFLTDTNGNTNSIAEGTLFWDVTPTEANAGPVICVGHFTLGQPMF